jgi:membrane-associated PAP2 superfamily phosphatase
LPTLALAIIAAAVQPRLLWYCAALTFTYSANVIAVYVMAHDQRGAPFFSRHDPWMTTVAFANIALFVWMLGPGRTWLDPEDRRAVRRLPRARRQPAPA